MPGFQDSAFLIVLALLLFGPKKLPQLARQAGKLMSDFRRASNEFRTQMEEELRISEQADRQKKVAAIEAAAPATPAIAAPETVAPEYGSTSTSTDSYPDPYTVDNPHEYAEPSLTSVSEREPTPEPAPEPVPIATSGDLSILPPATGLPIPNSTSEPPQSTESPAHESQYETETLHG